MQVNKRKCTSLKLAKTIERSLSAANNVHHGDCFMILSMRVIGLGLVLASAEQVLGSTEQHIHITELQVNNDNKLLDK